MKKELTHEEKKGYKYPSVTTVLGILRKPALEYYFKINSLDFINQESEKAKTIGTALHDAIFNHIERTGIDTETKYPDEVNICIQSFMKFKREHPEIKMTKSELKIEHPKLKYSGTLDCVAEIDGQPAILDWKSGQYKDKDELPIYNESLYQVSAYIKSYEKMFNLKIKKGIVVYFGKDKIGYNFIELDEKKIKKNFEIFKHCLKIYYLQKKK